MILKIDLLNAIRGHFPGVVMPKEGYREVAGALGAFIHVIVKQREALFHSLKIDFSGKVIHGDLEDVSDEDCDPCDNNS